MKADERKPILATDERTELIRLREEKFYAWRTREPSQRETEQAVLEEKVIEVFEDNKSRYGSPRILAELQARGECTSRKRIASIMKANGLCARRRRRLCRTTNSNHHFPIAENLLARNFEIDAPDSAWVTEISYIETGEGWLYLAAIIDLYSRAIVGWSMSSPRAAVSRRSVARRSSSGTARMCQ